jgi:hypothetical protein
MQIGGEDIENMVLNMMLEKKTFEKGTFSCLFIWGWAKHIMGIMKFDRTKYYKTL